MLRETLAFRLVAGDWGTTGCDFNGFLLSWQSSTSSTGLCIEGVDSCNLQGFQGVDYSTKGDRGNGPVQFEKDPAEADPFGLDQIISEVRFQPLLLLLVLLSCVVRP